jgi:peptidoglycan/xylan/chitin deacetylase (PgdA/CDA1 family)
MRLVSPLLKHAVYPALHRTGWLDRITPPGGFAVLCYHGVVPAGHSGSDVVLDGGLVRPQAFRQQIQFLKTHYHVIHPEDFRAWIEQGKPLPPRAVLLTCDDGQANNLTDMLPVLQSEGVSCLFFVTGASCGNSPGMLWYEELYDLMRAQPLNGPASLLPIERGAQPPPVENFQSRWWSMARRASQLDARAREDWMGVVRSHCGLTQTCCSESRPEKPWRLLSISELRQLADSGMSIGAHTLSHPVLSLCSEPEARHEIQQSKIDMERALGRPVWAFAYPFGSPSTMGEREISLAREAGFSCAFLNVEHCEGGHSDPFALSRTHVSLDMTLPEFAAHLCGLHTRLRRAFGG